MARVMIVKRLTGLYPVDEAAEAALRRFGQGEIVAVEVKKPRNLSFHRKFFAMLQIVLANQSYYKSMDDMLDVCKIRVGHCRTISTKQGDVQIPVGEGVWLHLAGY